MTIKEMEHPDKVYKKKLEGYYQRHKRGVIEYPKNDFFDAGMEFYADFNDDLKDKYDELLEASQKAWGLSFRLISKK